MRCQYQGCYRQAKYLMGWKGPEGTVWGVVCATHDRNLGRRNLAEAYNLPRAEMVAMDLRLDSEAKAERRI